MLGVDGTTKEQLDQLAMVMQEDDELGGAETDSDKEEYYSAEENDTDMMCNEPAGND